MRCVSNTAASVMFSMRTGIRALRRYAHGIGFGCWVPEHFD